jgi:hypothetical protein
MKINAQSSAERAANKSTEKRTGIDCFDIVSLWDNLLHNLRAV